MKSLSRTYSLPASLGWIFAALIATTAVSTAQEEIRPAEPIRPAVPVDPNETIRPAVPVEPDKPKSPEDDLWDFSMQMLAVKEYKLAIPQFEKFVKTFPSSPRVAEAYFRAGDCHMRLKDPAKAEVAFLNSLRKSRTGKFAGEAAYRMGRMRYMDANFKDAESFFAVAETQAEDPDTKLASLYLLAKSIDQQKRRAEAITHYQKLIDLGGENMFRESALREVAVEQMKAGDKDAALANFLKLIGEIDTAELEKNVNFPNNDERWNLLAEAMVKTGIIYDEKDQPEKAIEWFAKAVQLSDPKEVTKDWKAFASFSVIQSRYAAGDYEGVVRAYQGARGAVYSEKTQPKLLLSVGNSYRKLNKLRDAVDVFIKLEDEYPDTPEALEAGYRNLICFHTMKSARLPDFVDRYIYKYERKYPDHELLDRAILLKAEGLFEGRDYLGAAEYYGKLSLENIPEKMRASVLYKKGWAEAEAGKSEEAIDSFSEYIAKYEDAGDVASAIAKRALVYKEINDTPHALSDLQRVIKNHSDSPVMEMALQRSALIKGETRDLEGMIVDFQMLLEKFPDSKAAAEANYWIGWSNFELRRFEEAIQPLQNAEKLDASKYASKVALRLVLSNYYSENKAGLEAEMTRYLDSYGKANIPANVFYWIGVEKFKEEDYVAAEKYLSLGADPLAEEVPAVVWDNLAQARLATGKYEESIEAINYYLLDDKKPGNYLAKAYLVRARAQLGLAKYDEATESCDKGLEKVKEGRVNAELTICRGDIALAAGKALQDAGKNQEAAAKYKEAVGQFVRVSQVFVDQQITPAAMAKWATALDRLGEREEAAKIRKQLQAEYPGFRLSAGG